MTARFTCVDLRYRTLSPAEINVADTAAPLLAYGCAVSQPAIVARDFGTIVRIPVGGIFYALAEVSLSGVLWKFEISRENLPFSVYPEGMEYRKLSCE